MKTSHAFSESVLTWFKKHGRKNLPWQKNKTPYRVWVSEIMLQQTQVSTVIPYFERFLKKFPDIASLARAEEDEVLHLWTGLGYYSRARNLHKAAKIINEKFFGKFPSDFESIQNLPGIGRSTAGAILSIAFKKPCAILDGNVKRVLTRFYGIQEWPNEKTTLLKLWEIAEKNTPQKNPDHYAQAIMDLGATVCTRSKPSCDKCPLSSSCIAKKDNLTQKIPLKNPKKSLPVKQTTLLFIRHGENILLKKRPAKGIWGGLWCPPELINHATSKDIKKNLAAQFHIQTIKLQPVFRHTFTHFHLDILAAFIQIKQKNLLESSNQIWYNLFDKKPLGFPAPIQKLLRGLV